jgi:uncharacterized protein involved in exopolysaccharide biosynthesis/Mrp family chromosome partitioning ATPase
MQDQTTKTEYQPVQARSLRDYVRIVLARKWIVLFIFLASIGAIFYYLKTATPVYQTQVVIMRENAKQLPSTIIGIPLEKEEESISGHVELLESASSIAEITKLLKVNYNLEFGGKFSLQSDGDSIIRLTTRASTPKLSQALANTVAKVYIQKVADIKRSDLESGLSFLEKQIKLASEQIEQSEKALNEFRNKIGITQVTSSSGLLDILGNMQEELSKTESDIELIEAQLQSVQGLISEKRQASLSSLSTSLSPQIDTIQSRLISLQLQLDTMLEKFTKEDPEVISIQQQIDMLQKRLEAELAELLKKEGQTSLDPLSEIQSLVQQSISLNVQLKGLEQKKALLKKRIANFQEEHPELIATQVELTRLERQARVHEQTYMALLTKSGDLQLLKEMKTSGLDIIKEAALPQSPISPQKKKILIFGLISGLVLGVGFAFLLEYLDDSIKLKEDVERYLALPVMGTIPKIPPFKVPENALSRRALSTDSLSTDSGNGLTHPYPSEGGDGLNSDNQGNVTLPMPVPLENPDEDGENATGQPTESNLANLQSKRRQKHARGHRKRIKQLLSSILIYAEKRTPLLTNYQTLLANIRYANVDTPIQTLIVTSAAPLEGKTATVTNLAISMAQSGGKVLLIDTDLRRPRIHRLFQQDRSPGLTDLLSPGLQPGEDENNSIETVVETLSPPVETQGEHPIGEPFIRQTSIDNLYLLPCGTHVSRPEGLLSSEKMKQLIKSLSSQYDMVLFDTPPLISAADAMILATQVDATLMVVRSGKTKRQIALQGKELLENVDAHIIGAVLNNIDYSKQYGSYYYYYYYYRSYYYSSDDDEN